MAPASRSRVSAGARLRPGRSSAGGCQAAACLRGLHLDTACAPAVTWQLSGSGTKSRSAHSKCQRFQGNPERRLARPSRSSLLRAGHADGGEVVIGALRRVWAVRARDRVPSSRGGISALPHFRTLVTH